MEFVSQRLPRKEGYVVIGFEEKSLRNILLDLDSQSKVHRSGTTEFKRLSKDWLKRCDEMRNEHAKQ